MKKIDKIELILLLGLLIFSIFYGIKYHRIKEENIILKQKLDFFYDFSYKSSIDITKELFNLKQIQPNISLKDRELISLLNYINRLCKLYNIDFHTILTIITIESSWNYKKEGNSNDLGLMQITPICAKNYNFTHLSMLDPYQNISCGVRYFKDCVFSSLSIEDALICYNRGKSGLDSLSKEEKINNQYVKNFKKIYKLFK